MYNCQNPSLNVNWNLTGIDGKLSCLCWKSAFLENVVCDLTFEPTTLKCPLCHVDLLMSNCSKFHQNSSTHSGYRRGNASHSAYMTMYGLPVTLTFDLLTSKSSQFIFVPTAAKL